MSVDVQAVAALAARAELAWRDASGALYAAPIVPLTIYDDIVAALPFSMTPLARALTAADEAVLVCSDSRMAWKGWKPCVAPVTVEITADRAGEWTWTGALDQEVRKHPPARLLMDTAIQRREHWWYVPRWIVRLRVRSGHTAIARRAGPDDGLLLTSEVSGALRVRSVAVDDWQADRISVTPLDATSASEQPQPHDALLFTHDFSIPDQDRSRALEVIGTLEGRSLQVDERRGRLELPSPRLLQRLRRHYELERACRRALAVYDASSPPAT